MLRSPFLWLLAFATASCPCAFAADDSASPVPIGPKTAQLNVCGAGQWFIVVNQDHCEKYPGVTANPDWIGYIGVDDYLRWGSHKARADALERASHLNYLGDNKFASDLFKRAEARNSSVVACFPQAPARSAQGAWPALQMPGCNGAVPYDDPWQQASQCSPRSGLVTVVRRLVADQLEVPIERVEPRSDIIKDLGADALDPEELVMRVEETFSLEVRDEDAERIVTVQDLVNYLSSKICH